MKLKRVLEIAGRGAGVLMAFFESQPAANATQLEQKSLKTGAS